MSSEGSSALLHESSAWPKQYKAKTRTQIGRFLLVGGSCVAIDLAVYVTLVDSWGPISAKAVSYVAGMLFGFLGNKFWTFGSRRTSISEPLLYTLVYGISLAVNVGLNSSAIALLENLHVSEQIARISAFVIATGTTTVLNFVGLKFLAFRLTSQHSQ